MTIINKACDNAYAHKPHEWFSTVTPLNDTYRCDGVDGNDKDEIAVMLGFTIEHAGSTRPFLRYLDGSGALSRHGRPPTEAEVRMWHVLINEPYEPWSASGNSATSATLLRLGVGVPRTPGIRGGSGA